MNKECTDCEGVGRCTNSIYDPSDSHGYGEEEVECERCDGTGEIED